MIKLIATLSLVLTIVSAKDVSVFGAGDLESKSPYGLTKAEKASYKNTQKIQDLSFEINSIKANYDEIKQQFEGIKSVFDSDSKNLSNTKNKMLSVEQRLQNLEQITQDLQLQLNQFIDLQKENNRVLEESNQKLLGLINKINEEYISKKEFDELVGYINKKNQSNANKKVVNNAQNNFGFTSNEALFDYAVKMHGKNYLTKTMPMFDKLVKDDYKKASSSYYLADILHFKKRYKDAIYYYKQSMMLNDSAPYIPQLLLNSADSFEMLQDKTNAKNFYETLVDAYPNTKEAKIATKRLEKLK
jgi:TolA-binding protein